MQVQLIIVLLYFAVTVGIGVIAGKKTKGSDAFHGAGMGIMAIVFSSASEWLGGTATTGVSEYGFNSGLSGAWYTLANGIGVMVLALLFAKMYRSLGVGTVPAIIEKFFGKHARIVSSVLLTIVMLAVGISQMIAAGKLGESLMGFDFTITCVVFAAVFIVYTLAGGMNSVASTSTLHLLFMYFGAILAIILALFKVGGVSELKTGIAAVEAEMAAAGEKTGFFNMFTIGGSKVSSWIIASLLGACTAQAGIQPLLGAKDVPTAKKASILTAFVVAPYGLFTALLGIIARVMSHNGTLLDVNGNLVTDGKRALYALMMNLSPIAGGIILASILAAILSTASPIILASGTMITKDIYQRVFKPDASDKQILFVSRLTTALSGVVCCIVAILLVNSSKVLDIVYSAYSLRGALFIVVLYGIYWKRASEKAACISMVLTAVAAVVWVAVKAFTGSYPISAGFSETYAAVIVAAVSCFVLSYIFPKKELQQA